MKSIEMSITNEAGIHARPAGEIVKKAKEFSSTINISKDGKAVGATKLMSLLSLGVKQGDVVTITAEGDDEEAAAEAIAHVIRTEH
ncbi:MAG: PTS galactitol transporter subunit IIC [Epulopiscium sp. Nele67-Bin005]|nr:MAG: PTS galactitol transporter subunit IIC [Epulopiscium sp. Nele67-Bin005]